MMTRALAKLGVFAVACTVAVGSATAAQAGSLTTIFASNNEQDGNMFDIEVFDNALTVTGFDLNLVPFSSPTTIEVYLKSGTYRGSETNASAWSLISSGVLNSSNGEDNPTFLDVDDFKLDANSLYGLYLTTTNDLNFKYTNGTGTNEFFSNSDLSLTMGAGVAYPFESTSEPRVWNGTIYYDVETAAIPTPALLPGLIGMGAAALRRKREEEAAE